MVQLSGVDPETFRDNGEAVSKKNWGALWASFWSKNKGEGPQAPPLNTQPRSQVLSPTRTDRKESWERGC